MLGLEVRSAIEGHGAPWMLATDVAYQHGRELLGLGPLVIGVLADSTPRLSNLVSAGNTRAIRVLRRWGFTVGAEEKTVGGVPFLTFERIG